MTTLEQIKAKRGAYPTYLLEHAETGLCLFSAAFRGYNDVVHFALEEVQTTCVDIDAPKLEEMSELYPEDWRFVCRDAWEFAEKHAALGETWDVVSVDTFRGNATERSLASLDLWCSLANTAVVATLEEGQEYEAPEGWRVHTLRRNPTVLWLVLTRD